MNTIALKKLTDKDIDKFYSKSTLIRNASYRNMTIVQYRNWLKGTK